MLTLYWNELKRCAKISSFQRTAMYLITRVSTRLFADTLFEKISQNNHVETPLEVQTIWIVVSWKEKINAYRLCCRDSSQRVFSNNGSYILTWKKLSQSLGVSSEWYRDIESWLITSISFIKVMTFWTFFLKKKSHISCFFYWSKCSLTGA